VKTDHHGLIPSSLREVLTQWTPGAPEDQQNPVPKVLYTVPNGVNPTGASLTLERKQEIYKVCSAGLHVKTRNDRTGVRVNLTLILTLVLLFPVLSCHRSAVI